MGGPAARCQAGVQGQWIVTWEGTGCHVTWEVTSPGPQALSPPGGTRLRRAGYEDGLGRSLSWPNFARRPSLPEHLVLPMSEMTVYGAVYLVAHYSVALATVHYFLQLL